MIFITGDLHGEVERLENFYRRMDLTADDTIIVLGELGINFGDPVRNARMREEFDRRVPCTLFCVHGNHEQRPPLNEGYEQVEYRSGHALVHPFYPRQIFAIDGEVYDFPVNGVFRKVFVMGGAYSVDKPYRLRNGWPWFPDEQPSPAIKERGLRALDRLGWNVDIVLTHTCPASVMPIEWFMAGVDESGVDRSTEDYLESILRKLSFRKWYAAHFHGEKREGKFQFLYKSFFELEI